MVRDSGPTRVLFSASERREKIIAILIKRGVGSPLLSRGQPAGEPQEGKPTILLIPPSVSTVGPQMAQLLDLIGSAEAGSAGYDAIHHKARILPSKPPTRMTVQDILDWIDATPGQNHAIGRYQIIPLTLEYLITKEAIPLNATFSPQLQDRLAERLILDAGLPEFLAGLMPQDEFMDSLAYVWAGLPLRSGLSAYEGFAGNSATISRGEYETAFARIYQADDVRLAAGLMEEGAIATEEERQ